MKRKIMKRTEIWLALAIWAAIGIHAGSAQQSAIQSNQPSFPSAAEAGKSLFQAVESNNKEAIARILGGPTELASSGDEAQDKADRECFLQKYKEMHRIVHEPHGTVSLYIGAENWPFPVPLIEKDGAWRFDTETGQKEILFRRIGENELTAIAACHDLAAKNGDGSQANPADGFPAKLMAGGKPVLFHGYYFHVLAGPRKTAGGFAVVIAYPAEYRSSGVMTFVVTAKGAVYEKDLGSDTPALASAMAAFHKDATWRAAVE
jgi:hypothetical protein